MPPCYALRFQPTRFCASRAPWEAYRHGSFPLHNLVSESAHPHYVSAPQNQSTAQQKKWGKTICLCVPTHVGVPPDCPQQDFNPGCCDRDRRTTAFLRYEPTLTALCSGMVFGLYRTVGLPPPPLRPLREQRPCSSNNRCFHTLRTLELGGSFLWWPMNMRFFLWHGAGRWYFWETDFCPATLFAPLWSFGGGDWGIT